MWIRTLDVAGNITGSHQSLLSCTYWCMAMTCGFAGTSVSVLCWVSVASFRECFFVPLRFSCLIFFFFLVWWIFLHLILFGCVKFKCRLYCLGSWRSQGVALYRQHFRHHSVIQWPPMRTMETAFVLLIVTWTDRRLGIAAYCVWMVGICTSPYAVMRNKNRNHQSECNFTAAIGNEAPTLICRFIVMQNNVMKYITNIGQNTGMLNTSKNVQKIPITVLFEIAYQNLNSGNRRMNGRNSSFDRVGSSGPWSSVCHWDEENGVLFSLNHWNHYVMSNIKRYAPSRSNAGSIFGVKNAINKFKW